VFDEAPIVHINGSYHVVLSLNMEQMSPRKYKENFQSAEIQYNSNVRVSQQQISGSGLIFVANASRMSGTLLKSRFGQRGPVKMATSRSKFQSWMMRRLI
jgi:hypothetical protein